MGGQMDGRMTNISLKKKRACMHAYQNDTEQRERGKITLQKKASQNKQKKAINSAANTAGIAAKPRDNSEMNESVKVSNNTVQLRNAKQRIYL